MSQNGPQTWSKVPFEAVECLVEPFLAKFGLLLCLCASKCVKTGSTRVKMEYKFVELAQTVLNSTDSVLKPVDGSKPIRTEYVEFKTAQAKCVELA